MRNDFREDHSSTSEALICITITKSSKLKSSILSRKVYNRVRNLVIEKVIGSSRMLFVRQTQRIQPITTTKDSTFFENKVLDFIAKARSTVCNDTMAKRAAYGDRCICIQEGECGERSTQQRTNYVSLWDTITTF